MKKALFVFAAVVGLGAMGCAPNPSVGTGITTAQKYFGDLGVQGHNQNVTVLKGSRVTKLSLIGNNNTVSVEDGAAVYRIEFWGNGNTVIVPDNLWILRTNNVGTNQVVRRPTAGPPVIYEPLPESPPTAPGNQPQLAPATGTPPPGKAEEPPVEEAFQPEDK